MGLAQGWNWWMTVVDYAAGIVKTQDKGLPMLLTHDAWGIGRAGRDGPREALLMLPTLVGDNEGFVM